MATADFPSISALTPEAKRKLLGELLKDLTLRESSVTLSVEGISLHVYRPPEHAREDAEQFLRSQTMDDAEEMRRRANDADAKSWLTMEEMTKLVIQDAERQSR